MAAVIRTEALTKRFRGVAAVNQISLQVDEAAVYALVGPNGAGKTTSIKIFMNLLKATSGYAQLMGMDSKTIRGKAYTQIGYVSENQEIPEWMKVGALLGMIWLSQIVPSASIDSAAETVGATEWILLFAGIIAALGWQYARRKTWASRGVLLGSVVVIALIQVVTPYAKFVEAKYPFAEDREPPAQIALEPVCETAKKSALQEWLPETNLRIPLRISGIALGKVVMLNGTRVIIDAPNGNRLDPGWRAEWSDLWPEDQR
jgi:energy-coupling factor transporter ATP-binding protein EcfA2